MILGEDNFWSNPKFIFLWTTQLRELYCFSILIEYEQQ